jgi:hypothetical protein
MVRCNKIEDAVHPAHPKPLPLIRRIAEDGLDGFDVRPEDVSKLQDLIERYQDATMDLANASEFAKKPSRAKGGCEIPNAVALFNNAHLSCWRDHIGFERT